MSTPYHTSNHVVSTGHIQRSMNLQAAICQKGASCQASSGSAKQANKDQALNSDARTWQHSTPKAGQEGPDTCQKFGVVRIVLMIPSLPLLIILIIIIICITIINVNLLFLFSHSACHGYYCCSTYPNPFTCDYYRYCCNVATCTLAFL